MAAYDSIYPALVQSVMDLYGQPVMYARGGGSSYEQMTGVWDYGALTQAQYPGSWGKLYCLESSFFDTPTKQDEFLIVDQSNPSGQIYVVAKDPRDCMDGQGGLNLILRKK